MLRCPCRFCRGWPTVEQGWVIGWGMIELPCAPIVPGLLQGSCGRRGGLYSLPCRQQPFGLADTWSMIFVWLYALLCCLCCGWCCVGLQTTSGFQGPCVAVGTTYVFPLWILQGWQHSSLGMRMEGSLTCT